MVECQAMIDWVQNQPATHRTKNTGAIAKDAVSKVLQF